MAKNYNLVGMQHDEMYDIIKKAPSGSIFHILKSQTQFLQLRVNGLSKSLAKEYAQAIHDKKNIDPGEAYFDPETGNIYLADGAHRAEAHIILGVESGIPAEDVPFPVYMHIGNDGDALLAASGANAGHGARRTRSDMANAVCELLLHPELGRWSNGRLAKAADVSVPYIEKVRERLEAEGFARVAKEDRIGERNGKPYRHRAKATDSASNPATEAVPESATPQTLDTSDASATPTGTPMVTDTNTSGATSQLPTPAKSASKVDEGTPKANECGADAQPLPQDSDATITETAHQFAEALKAALDNVPLALREPTRLELLNTLKNNSFAAPVNSETNNI